MILLGFARDAVHDDAPWRPVAVAAPDPSARAGYAFRCSTEADDLEAGLYFADKLDGMAVAIVEVGWPDVMDRLAGAVWTVYRQLGHTSAIEVFDARDGATLHELYRHHVTCGSLDPLTRVER